MKSQLFFKFQVPSSKFQVKFEVQVAGRKPRINLSLRERSDAVAAG